MSVGRPEAHIARCQRTSRSHSLMVLLGVSCQRAHLSNARPNLNLIVHNGKCIVADFCACITVNTMLNESQCEPRFKFCKTNRTFQWISSNGNVTSPMGLLGVSYQCAYFSSTRSNLILVVYHGERIFYCFCACLFGFKNVLLSDRRKWLGKSPIGDFVEHFPNGCSSTWSLS